jgi:Flp pilus assembly protein CpaB
MTYRVRNIAIAVGLALVAMLLTLLYVTNYKRSVQHSDSNVQVYVAAHDIVPGISGTELIKNHDLKTEEVAQRNVVAGAISNPEQIKNQVLSQPLLKGDEVSVRRFNDLAAQGLRGQLKGTTRAVQVAGDANQLLAGTLKAGDHVDLVANLRVSTTDQQSYATRIVLRDLSVLAVPSTSSGPTSAISGTNSVILAVTDTQVQRLFYVLKDADWTLELRPVVDPSDSPERIDTLTTVLTGGVR